MAHGHVPEPTASNDGAYQLRAGDLSPRADWRMEDTRIAYVTARVRDGHEIARAGSGMGIGRDGRRAYLPLALAGR